MKVMWSRYILIFSSGPITRPMSVPHLGMHFCNSLRIDWKFDKGNYIYIFLFLWKACFRYYWYIVAFYIMSISIQLGCPMWCLSMSIPGASNILGFWYLWHPYPCGKHWLLRLPKGRQTWLKITTTKVVSGHIHKTKYCLHLRPSGHISWKHAARKNIYIWLLSRTLTENW